MRIRSAAQSALVKNGKCELRLRLDTDASLAGVCFIDGAPVDEADRSGEWLSLWIDEPSEAREVELRLDDARTRVALSPVRRRDVYLVPRIRSESEIGQAARAMADRDAGQTGASMRATIVSTNAMVSYLERAAANDRADIASLMRTGMLSVCAEAATGQYETCVRALYPYQKLVAQTGAKLLCARCSGRVPPENTLRALCDAGVLMLCVERAGRECASIWNAPDGQTLLLIECEGPGRTLREGLANLGAWLADAGAAAFWPLENCPLKLLTATVKSWNAQHDTPKLILTDDRAYRKRLLETPAELPALHGAPEGTPVFTECPEALPMIAAAQRLLLGAENLNALLPGRSSSATHAYGALVAAQRRDSDYWRQGALADYALRCATDNMRDAMTRLTGRLEARGPVVLAANLSALAGHKRAVASVPKDALASFGERVRLRAADSGETLRADVCEGAEGCANLLFTARDLPPFGYRAYRLEPESAPLARSLSVQNAFYRLGPDGRIEDLIAGRDVFAAESRAGLSVTDAEGREQRVDWTRGVALPGGASRGYLWRGSSRGLPEIELTLRLFDDVDRVFVTLRVTRLSERLKCVRVSLPFSGPGEAYGLPQGGVISGEGSLHVSEIVTEFSFTAHPPKDLWTRELWRADEGAACLYANASGETGAFGSQGELARVIGPAAAFFKPAENGDGVIARLYNPRPEAALVRLELCGRKIGEIWRCDALERGQERVEDEALLVPPYARATLRLRELMDK